MGSRVMYGRFALLDYFLLESTNGSPCLVEGKSRNITKITLNLWV